MALPWSDAVSTATTVDLALQAALERLAAEQTANLPDHAGIAMLIADLPTRDILALTSATAGPQGAQLDLTQAIRSPGSALKPFIYAMAFEAGIAGPATLLDDLPRRFGAYAPENFDRVFQGRVTMAEALRRSLNLPAVALLAAIGPGQFMERLRVAGVRLRLPARPVETMAASLPLALGGAGISLREAARLYAALGTDGVVRPLRLVQGAMEPGLALVSPRAAATIGGILTQPFPDGGPAGIAWKTGTSWGGRDAWALGFDGRHVAAIWVGRPDGAPLPGATGRALALPVLARLFALLPAAPRPSVAPVEPVLTSTRPDTLRLLFPPPEAVVSGDGPLTLRAMGGRRPLVFLVDGVRLASEPARREVGWHPQGAGFYRLTVLDADGQAARSVIRVK
jgi:penicillin-binding protein 1C